MSALFIAWFAFVLIALWALTPRGATGPLIVFALVMSPLIGGAVILTAAHDEAAGHAREMLWWVLGVATGFVLAVGWLRIASDRIGSVE